MATKQPSRTEIFDWRDVVRLFFTGFGMGAADIVPGVSGGTIAFIFGVYEELIYSIKVVSGQALKLFLQGKIKESLALIPFRFLIPLGLGIMGALLTLAKLVSFLLHTYPEMLWSFFFGLVIASVLVVRKRVVTWDFRDIGILAVSTIVAYFIVGAVPVETPETLLAYFLSGAVAICAMILPGISGSFLLVIMGKYEQVLGAVLARDFMTLGAVGAGAILGLALFSRVLSWAFAKHHDLVVAALIGFMLGSLRKIWPWKEVVSTRINRHGDLVPLVERNFIPSQFDLNVFMALGLCALGIFIILFLSRLHAVREQVQDIEPKKFAREHEKALKLQEHK